ncbi:DUF3955 domain-containing protein [Clostridium perfringens]|nr:DUF3955 domain-containing protein [Clostridium perfringens]
MKKYILNSIPFLIVVICIIAFNIIGSEVLPDGTLVEPFFLIPIAYLALFVGVLNIGVQSIVSLIKKRK